jgi:CRP/FNR family transcriptional regulator, cyclic AMP receptor protein
MSDDENPDPTAVLAHIVGDKSEFRYYKDQIVYSQGEPADCAYLIHSGNAKVTIVSPEGREAVVGILLSGDFCGEECLTGGGTRAATVIALNNCLVTRIEKAGMVRAIRADHAFAELLISYLTARQLRTQADLADQLLNSTEMRLARLFLTLAKHGDGEGLVPKIKQETLAEMIGTSRTHVNFFMNKFRRLGFIEYNGEIKVHKLLLSSFLRGQL